MKKWLFLIVTFVIILGFNLVKADLTIDGNGGSFELSPTGTLSIATGGRLTLRNVTVDKLSGNAVTGRLVAHNSTSQLVLQNSTLTLDGNYSFTNGSLVIKGDTTITGSAGTLFTFNGHNILIDNGATLRVKNVTFQAAPTARNRQLVKFGNKTSQFLLEDATFKVNNAPSGLLRSGGLVMVGGNLVIEGSSIIDNSGTASMHALQLGNAGYSSSDCRLVVRPNSKLTVKNAGIVFKNVGSGSLDLSGGRGTLDIDSATNANFLIETPVNLANSTFNFDFSTLTGLSRNIFYGFDAVTTELAHGAILWSIDWSIDGQYLATGGNGVAGPIYLRVHSFDGSTLAVLPGCNKDTGATVHSVSWNPDGQYLTIGGSQGTGNYTNRVYSFDGSNLTELVGCRKDHGNMILTISLSPDGKYLAIGGAQSGVVTQRVYSFDGSSLSELLGCRANHGAQVLWVSWSPNGKYLAVCGNAGTGGYDHRVYSFNGSSLIELTNCRKIHGGTGVCLVSWSPDGKYLAIGGYDGTGGYEIRMYSFDCDSLSEILGCRIDVGGDVKSMSWSPDGKFLAFGGDEVGGTVTHYVYEFDGSSLTELVNCRGNHDTSVYSVSWYPDGRYFAIGGGEAAVDNMTHRVYPSLFTSSQALLQFQNSTLNLGGKTFKSDNMILKLS